MSLQIRRVRPRVYGFFRGRVLLFRLGLGADALELAHRPALLHGQVRRASPAVRLESTVTSARACPAVKAGLASTILAHALRAASAAAEGWPRRDGSCPAARPPAPACQSALLHQRSSRPAASSMGLRSSRCRFSISASLQPLRPRPNRARCAGISFRPGQAGGPIAPLARNDRVARRRSLRHHDGLDHAHRCGWTPPAPLSAFSSKARRGWSGIGDRCSRWAIASPRRSCPRGLLLPARLSPNSAPSPLPKPCGPCFPCAQKIMPVLPRSAISSSASAR